MPRVDVESRRAYDREHNRERRKDPAYREAKRAYDRERDRKRYTDRIAEARWWLGDRCLHCGATENLEFDHIDPATKSFEVAAGWRRSARRFFDELEKCQLLCKPCHSVKTAEDRRTGRFTNGRQA